MPTVIHQTDERKRKLIAFVLDQSGSMYPMIDETTESFASYFSEVAKEHPEADVMLTFFNSANLKVIDECNIGGVKSLKEYEYYPTGYTPLDDAIGLTIRKVDEYLAKHDATVIFVILTDGKENASKEFSREAINKLREDREAKGWAFVFLGCNIDAYEIASGYGIGRLNTMSYGGKNTKAAYAAVAEATRSYLTNDGSGISLDDIPDS